MRQEERFTVVLNKEIKEKFIKKAEDECRVPSSLLRQWIVNYIKEE